MVDGAGASLGASLIYGLIGAVGGVGAALGASLIIGPAAVEGLGLASGPNNIVYSVPVAEGVGTMETPFSADVVEESYNPDAVTTQTFETIRATNPASLGDGQAHTYVNRTAIPALPNATGRVEVKATAMADVPAEQQFPSISHVVFRCMAWIFDVGPSHNSSGHTSWPGWPTHPGTRMAWSVSALEAESPLINDDPTIGVGQADGVEAAGFCIVKDADGFDPEDGTAPFHFLHTANILTQPNGNPWTWAAINALADVCVRWSWAGASPAIQFADLSVAEIWVEVYGPQGSQVTPLKLRLKAGNLRLQLNVAEDLTL